MELTSALVRPLLPTLLWCIATLACRAQNLIPNPSFEDTALCNEAVLFSAIETAPPWYTPNTATPDLYTIQPDPGCGMYYDEAAAGPWGWVSPVQGLRFAGIIGRGFEDESKDYVAVRLNEALEPGTTYTLSLHVRLGLYCQYAVPRLGALFTLDSITYPYWTTILDAPSIYLYGASDFLDNTTSWQLITADYLAAGGEQYLIIGNFDTAAEAAVLERPGNFVSQTYYFLDQLALVPATGQGVAQQDAVRYANGRLWGLGRDVRGLRVVDASGRVITERSIQGANDGTWPVGLDVTLTPGAYVVVLHYANGVKAYRLGLAE